MEINDQFKDRIQHVANLPTLPQIASRLLRIINDPLTSSNDVAFVIGQDLSLSAKVLRLANSAFYGVPKSITNINSAVVILGLKVLHTIVLGLTVFDMFPENKRTADLFNRKAFWLHSLSCGLIAKFLASRIRKFILFDPEEAFCAGLLHDIGKVVMEQYLHEDFHQALLTAQKKNISMFEAENETLGYNHTQVAEWLTASWGLPAELQLPLIYHHSPSDAGQFQDIIALCHLSDNLCYELGMNNEKYIAPKFDIEATQILKLDEKDIDDLKDRFPTEMEKMIVFFDIAHNTK
jgi:HD-like signal output (HDOD) protein